MNIFEKIALFFEKNKFLSILLIITFFVRLPSLYEPFWYGDEAIYAVIGQKILHGGLMYVDIFDHKTPGIYYLTAAALRIFGQTIWSLHFLLMVWVLVTLVVFFFLAKKLFDEKVAKIATAIFALLTATPLIEGNIFNSELLMVLPVSIGILLGLKKKYFLAGVFFSLGLLLKFPAIFDFGAFFVFLTLSTTRLNLRENIKSLALLTSGYFLPVFLTGIYFFSQKALGTYIFSALIFNFSYTNYGNQLAFGPFIIPNGLVLLKGLPLLALIIYFFWKLYLHLAKERDVKKPVTNLELIILWLAFGYYGAVFGGRPYPHYLIQAAPGLSLLLAVGIVKENYRKLSFGIAVAVVALTLLLGFKPFITPWYYPNFFRFVTKQIGEEEYLNSFDAKTARNYSLASFLDGCSLRGNSQCTTTRTTSKDNIYIWGNSPVIYFLSQRDPTSKYITAFHVAGNDAFKTEVIDAVKKRHPIYILKEASAPDFPALDNILGKQYNFFAQTDDIKIYQRLGSLEAD